MARAFVAVVLPAVVLDEIDACAARLATALARTTRLTPREQWHVTLRFLGDDADLDAVAAALDDLAVTAGEVRMGGLGAFPNARRARVVWLGVAQGGRWLAQAAAAVGALCEPAGHAPDTRPFRPHVTLARCRTPTDVRSIVAAGTEPVGPSFTVREVVLFESVLGGDGARHRAHLRVSLA